MTNYFKNRQSAVDTSNSTNSSLHPPPPTALATENAINERKRKNRHFRRSEVKEEELNSDLSYGSEYSMDNGNSDAYYKMKPNLVKRLSVYYYYYYVYRVD